jgi:putative hydrolase of the HAD superfamily
MPLLRRPQFVFLDLGNVIALFDRDRAHRQMAAVAGTTVATVEEAVADGLQERLESGALDWPGYVAEFARRTGTSPDPGALAHAASDMFSLNPAIVPVIAALQRARCPIGILSNTCAPHWHHLLACRWAVLPGPFACLVLSHEVGGMKPRPGIYATAAVQAGVEPEGIFFTDDMPANVAAARAAGWDAEPFESAHRLADDLMRRGVALSL